MKNPKHICTAFFKKLMRTCVFVLLSSVLVMMCCCSKDNEPTTDLLGAFNAKTLVHEGVERSYHLYLPNDFDKASPAPLVLALHGGGGTGENFEDDVSAGTLTAAAEARGMILVMPDGIDKKWNSGRPELFADGSIAYDDVGFIETVIDTMIAKYGVDPSQVYSTGISAGGFMSLRLAVDLSEKIAAIAPVTAQMVATQFELIPSSAVSIMIINGTADPLVPYDGGCISVPSFPECSRGIVISTEETIDNFRGFYSCSNPVEIDPLIDDLPDNTSIEVFRYDGCGEGSEVVLVKVNGGGHTWPGGEQYLPASIVGPVSKEINASEMILDFFLSHTRN